MSTGLKFVRYAGIVFLCLGTLVAANGATAKGQRKAKKPQLPPLPSGPTGRPVPQIPLDSIATVPPQVDFQNGQLTIVAPNSTLGDVLRAIKKQTGADIDVPSANERVVTRLGPGPARDVIAELLNGSRFNYVLLGSAENTNLLTRVVLVPKAAGAPDTAVANNNPVQQSMTPQPMMQPASMPPTPVEMASQDDQTDTGTEDAAQDDSNADQTAADADQQQQQQQQPVDPNQGQSEIKTPQQMLQEMQQRQMQLQQQQQSGQPPVPGSGMPPHPPQQP
jgi:hypothetical protein